MAWEFTDEPTGSTIRLIVKGTLPLKQDYNCLHVFKEISSNTWAVVSSDQTFLEQAALFMEDWGLTIAYAEQV